MELKFGDIKKMDYDDIAKHFYELGLKSKKGE